MIGWTRCHYACGCLDEDACQKAPKNQKKRNPCLYPAPEGSRWLCKCHRHMEADFWFLPTDRCLYGEK